ncbi:MAG: hypothetical protein UV54_C0001G0013 [Candidatus Beckwithbacteria bacterium GW2011_GWA2_43_10]|uniref:Ribbon-helix-helix protein CopG domain-containing protein n=1 Tax=Candidatus Beckwithbacteria bacterium GW2011_GWA2_43_10 TaxID=1618369 RepID=A0A0G1F1H0_9BACT|nr:MAG: hypothetical protein UV54_C0001G0013 [Candidatus Beckwithbacteria bacterium GW2011_GWA2_43_10]
MCMLTKRVNFLFEEETLQMLRERAAVEQESVGELVRRAVKKTYVGDNKQRKIAKAIRDIRRIRKVFKNIDYKELINAGRKY